MPVTTARSIRRQSSNIAVVELPPEYDASGEYVIVPRRRHIETAWFARNLDQRDRAAKRHAANKSVRKAEVNEARAVALDRNRARIAALKAAGLPLPGQPKAA